MLHLKRASAGSGKTYALAKTYIRLLISYRNPGEPRGLRPAGSLASALPSIMAVTFTVKATEEMKSRIVEKLAALAKAADTDDPQLYNNIDYLRDFMEEFNATRQEVAEASRMALRVLLLHYSDFRVSTIDTFFQSILHTFAYEVNLDDTFNLEIDSGYVATMGFNAALDTIAAAKGGNTDLLYWLKELMNDKAAGNQWNIFQRRDNMGSLYSDLIGKTSELDKEKFKKIRERLEEYFDSLPRDFRYIVKDFDDANIFRWKSVHDARRLKAGEILETLEAMGLDVNAICYSSYGPRYIMESLKEFNPKSINLKYFKKLSDKPGKSLGGKAKEDIKKGRNPAGISSLSDPLVASLDEKIEEWNELAGEFASFEPEIRLWQAYRKMLPLLKIVMEISRLKREYLEATNSFEISDTNSILKTIIGDNDTPFIYERMGSVIRHFLIDEFQDTSRMQWDNFYPLLRESVDNGYDDLIIGDAKQSIYRFRNADYSLISREVEQQFEGQVILSSEDVIRDPEIENTNFRSMVNVVEFNNRLFSVLTEPGHEWSGMMDGIAGIYADCEQAVPRKVREMGLGYVELNFYPALTKEDKESEDSVGYVSLGNPGFRHLARLILDLKDRGYDYKDIGILVRTNREGDAVVAVLTEYNSQHPESPIPMISEESLLLKNSSAVRLILYALELASKGPRSEVAKNPVLRDPVEENELYQLLHSLQSMALPSVVEAVISRFMPHPDESDIPYIAAFQDAVLEYSSAHSSDIGSFLKWWDKKSKGLSITTPDESDGVRILTVHKSKGLQYRCVIVPYLDYSFLPSRNKTEWRWIVPDDSLENVELLPPFIPVETGKMIEGTVHESELLKFYKEVTLDALNSIYVAFTRAIDELYVFGDRKIHGADSWASNIIEKIALKMPDADVQPFRYNDDSDVEGGEAASTEGDDSDECPRTISFGRPLSRQEVMDQKKRKVENARLTEMLGNYKSFFGNELLQFNNAQTSVGMEAREDQEADSEEIDPRSEGHRKHMLMEMVKVEADLDKAVRKLLVSGLINAKEADVWRVQLMDAMETVRQRGWFDPANRVLNERTIIQYKEKNRRPDRIIVRPDGKAVIIDYKFGDHRNEYRAQVRGYMKALVDSGLFPSVEGYLWYVNDGRIEEINLNE